MDGSHIIEEKYKYENRILESTSNGEELLNNTI